MDKALTRWHAVNSYCPHIVALMAFLGNATRTLKGSKRTNIMNQVTGITYELPFLGNYPDTNVFKFFELASKIPKVMHLSERQYFHADDGSGNEIEITHSCLELDIDKYRPDNSRIEDAHIQLFIMEIADIFDEILNLSDINKFYAAYLIKDIVTTQKGYKESIHLRFFLKMSKETKYYIFNSIMTKTPRGPLDRINCTIDDFDRQSVSYPVMLYNSAKKSSLIAHRLHAVYEIDRNLISGGWRVNTNKRPINNYQLELSVNYADVTGIITKPVVNAKEELHTKIVSNNLIYTKDDTNQVMRIINDADTLCAEDVDAEYTRTILFLLSPGRYDNFDSWKSIICIIARYNTSFKPILIQFSMQSGKWDDESMNHLNGIWAWAIRNNDGSGRTIKTLYHYAQQDNPSKFADATNQSMYKQMNDKVMSNCGNLNEVHLSDMLYHMYNKLFVSDAEAQTANKNLTTRVWYQFVMPEQDEKDLNSIGPYKWRFDGNYPDLLDKYISDSNSQLARVLDQFIAHLSDISNESNEASEIKYYTDCKKKLYKIKRNLGNSTYIRGILTRCVVKFRIKGFTDVLDKNGQYIGVLNGVLQLKPSINLIQHYHEIPISRTADAYVELGVETPAMIELEREIRRLFADDEDAFIFVMCFLASSLDGNKKDPFILFMLGEGSNGKSFLLELHINTLRYVGDRGYAAKLDSSYFTKEKANSGGTDTETVMLKNARFTYTSETSQGQYLKMIKIKQLLGETMSANDKYKTQEMFEVNSLFAICTNYDPSIEGSDYGTWRRILVYYFKMTFKENPDPNNPREWKINDDLIKTYPKSREWKNAYFGLLLKWYSILQNKYKGRLSNIPKPTIDRETQNYRSEQDALSLFIYEKLSPHKDESIELHTVAASYCDWVSSVFGRREQLNNVLTKLKKHFKLNIATVGKKTYLTKYRFAIEGDDKDEEGNLIKSNANNQDTVHTITNEERLKIIEKHILEMGITDINLHKKFMNEIRSFTKDNSIIKSEDALEEEAYNADLQLIQLVEGNNTHNQVSELVEDELVEDELVENELVEDELVEEQVIDELVDDTVDDTVDDIFEDIFEDDDIFGNL